MKMYCGRTHAVPDLPPPLFETSSSRILKYFLKTRTQHSYGHLKCMPSKHFILIFLSLSTSIFGMFSLNFIVYEWQSYFRCKKYINFAQKRIQNPVEHLRWRFL